MRIPFHRFKTCFYIFAVCFCFYGDQPPRWMGHPEIKFNFFTIRYKEKEVPIRPCKLKSDSAPPGSIRAQFEPKQPHQKTFTAHAETETETTELSLPFLNVILPEHEASFKKIMREIKRLLLN